MIYIVSLAVFTSVILALVLLLLFIESKVMPKGNRQIVINSDEDNALTVPLGASLLSALVANEIYLPSACGGSGSCGQCRCRVIQGGGAILPTELPHLTRHEKQQNVRLACQLKVRNDMAIEIPAEIFAIKKYAGTVASNHNIGTFIKELVIDLDEPIAFEAGQYVQIDIPPYKVSFADFDIDEVFRPTWDAFDLWQYEAENDEPVYRAYSLANPPVENQR
ncbi:MAG: 2Fe-2S iron-sulfur cluster-binding protein, partial [Thermodesulfobacteriota bacterium]